MAYSEVKLLPVAQFGTFDGEAAPGAGETLWWGHLLARISNSGRLEDHFLVKICGSQLLTASFAATAITEAADLQGYSFTLERRPMELHFKNNSFVSKWEDLVDLVAANKVMARLPDNASADQNFREAWEKAKSTCPELGVALRWSVQAHPQYGFKLVLQSLPCSARALRRDARLAGDLAAGIELHTWTVPTTMGRPGQWIGPEPVLFAPDVTLAANNLRAHPDRFGSGG
jgi:hypothetical protein